MDLHKQRITVAVVPRARQEKVEEQQEGFYKAWVRAVPEGGKANEALIELLATYFHVSKSQVVIVIGKTSREKIVDIYGGAS